VKLHCGERKTWNLAKIVTEEKGKRTAGKKSGGTPGNPRANGGKKETGEAFAITKAGGGILVTLNAGGV